MQWRIMERTTVRKEERRKERKKERCICKNSDHSNLDNKQLPIE